MLWTVAAGGCQALGRLLAVCTSTAERVGGICGVGALSVCEHVPRNVIGCHVAMINFSVVTVPDVVITVTDSLVTDSTSIAAKTQ